MATTGATTRTITNAWVDRTLPDIFYEEPEPPEDALVQERAVHRYVDGVVHTNTIEVFWSLVKRSWYGQQQHYSRTWAIAYAVEGCCKYNTRNLANSFGRFLQSAMGVA